MKIVIVLAFCMVFGGCVFNYSISHTQVHGEGTSKKAINMTAGIKTLNDARPSGDRRFTMKMTDLPAKLTEKLFDHFQAAGIFREVHYPSQPEDVLMIEGTINRFMTYSRKCMGFSPFDFCVNDYVDITLTIKDSSSGVIIAEFNGTGGDWNGGSWIREGNLNQAFKEAAKELLEQCYYQIIVGLNYQKVDFSDGVDKQEALYIAQKYCAQNNFTHVAYERKHFFPPLEQGVNDSDGQWLVKFIKNPYNIYLVFIDKQTGKVNEDKAVYNEDAAKYFPSDAHSDDYW